MIANAYIKYEYNSCIMKNGPNEQFSRFMLYSLKNKWWASFVHSANKDIIGTIKSNKYLALNLIFVFVKISAVKYNDIVIET